MSYVCSYITIEEKVIIVVNPPSHLFLYCALSFAATRTTYSIALNSRQNPIETFCFTLAFLFGFLRRIDSY